LARDDSQRSGRSIAASRREVSTFVQNVHRFIDAHFSASKPPPDRVVIFDEAQRAWNREQSQRKFKRNKSEPEIMLEIMDRHPDWAFIVALVGSGQEINTGEAGLGEWGRALAAISHTADGNPLKGHLLGLIRGRFQAWFFRVALWRWLHRAVDAAPACKTGSWRHF
jgi:hypothetical protein